MDGLSHMEQVWCREQNMSKNMSHMQNLIFDGFPRRSQKMMFITDTAENNWIILILAHLLVKSLVNQNRNFEPVGKLSLNVHILESLSSEGKIFFFRAFHTDPSQRSWAKKLLINTSLICAVSPQPTTYCRSGMRKHIISTPR
jgi:hypothetical protein